MTSYHQIIPDHVREWRPESWRAVVVALGILAGIALIAWGAWFLWMNTPPALDDGTVEQLRFIPEHEEDYMRAEYYTEPYTYTSCSGSGDTYRCTTRTGFRTRTIWVPDTRIVPDRWDLLIDGCSVTRNGDTVCREEWINVSQAAYNTCERGMTWRRETACRLR